jgi:hypothetical protein
MSKPKFQNEDDVIDYFKDAFSKNDGHRCINSVYITAELRKEIMTSERQGALFVRDNKIPYDFTYAGGGVYRISLPRGHQAIDMLFKKS